MTEPVPSPPLARVFFAAGTLLFVGLILHLGARVLVPVIEAVIVWFVLNGLIDVIRRLPLGRRLPWWAALILAATILAVFALLVIDSTVRAVASLGPRASALQEALSPMLDSIAGRIGTEREVLLDRMIDALHIETALMTVVSGMFGLVSQISVVAIYVGFLLVDQHFFDIKLRALIPDPERRAHYRALFARVGRSIQTYLGIMAFVSLLTAALSYAILLVVGVESAFFLAATIFVLNFIPTIGSIIGTVLPAAFAAMQFQAFGPTIVVLAGVGIVQFAIGNILLPRLAGGSLNISLFVVILSLFAFGAIWGVTGMFVAMPLTAMLIIVFAAFEATRPLAILLSGDGKVDPPESEAAIVR